MPEATFVPFKSTQLTSLSWSSSYCTQTQKFNNHSHPQCVLTQDTSCLSVMKFYYYLLCMYSVVPFTGSYKLIAFSMMKYQVVSQLFPSLRKWSQQHATCDYIALCTLVNSTLRVGGAHQYLWRLRLGLVVGWRVGELPHLTERQEEII